MGLKLSLETHINRSIPYVDMLRVEYWPILVRPPQVDKMQIIKVLRYHGNRLLESELPQHSIGLVHLNGSVHYQWDLHVPSVGIHKEFLGDDFSNYQILVWCLFKLVTSGNVYG